MESPLGKELDTIAQWMNDIFEANVQVPEDIFGPPPEMDEDDDPSTPSTTTGGDGKQEATPSPTQEDRQYLSHNEKRFEDGYDSKDHDRPYVPPYVETVDKNEDTIVPTWATAPIVDNTTTTITETPNDIPKGVIVPIDDDVLKKMTNPKLKIKLKLRNKTVGGNKNELVAQLRAALLKPKFTTEVLELVRNATKKKATAKNTTSGLKLFPTTAWWRPLIPNEEVIVDPENPSFNNKVRPPTVEQRDVGKVFGKHNFDEEFDIPLFATTDQAHQQRRERDAHVMKNGKRVPVYLCTCVPVYLCTCVPVYKQVLQKKGIVDPDFMKKHDILSQSLPHKIVEVFMPLNKQRGCGLFPKGGEKKALNFRGDFETICIWTNAKAKLAGAGPGGSYYPDFVDFTPIEIRQHFSVYIHQSLSPCPRVEMKFKTQVEAEDKINGNNCIANTLGQNSINTCRHNQMFKAFLALQDPMIPIPRCEKYPNWKVRPIITWMNFIFPTAWLLGIAIAIDKMTMGFQGCHQDKKRITYKVQSRR